MADYPFTLKGQQRSFRGRGSGETYKSGEFTLHQGIVVAEITHHGSGDFKLRFLPTEGFSEGETTAASIGGGAAAGFATGAVVGSVIPVAGTLVGGLLGAAAGWLAGDTIGNALGPHIWTPVETTGRFSTVSVVQVAEDAEDKLPPGKYRLEVESKSGWECRFIQPALGQADMSLLSDDDEGEDEAYDSGLYIVGPFQPTRRPTLASIRHFGGGEFYAAAFSLDGTHQCDIHEEQGQLYKDQLQTEIRPGKEYMLLIGADSKWNITFGEGY